MTHETLQAGFSADTIEICNGAISTFFDGSNSDVLVRTGSSIAPVTLQDSFTEFRTNTLRAKSLTVQNGSVVGCLECEKARKMGNDAFGYAGTVHLHLAAFHRVTRQVRRGAE